MLAIAETQTLRAEYDINCLRHTGADNILLLPDLMED